MFIDWTYIYLVLPAVIFAMWASAKVNSAFQRYSKVYSRNNITGREAAQMVLQENGVFGVQIERVSGNLSNRYEIRAQTRFAFRMLSITAHIYGGDRCCGT